MTTTISMHVGPEGLAVSTSADQPRAADATPWVEILDLESGATVTIFGSTRDLQEIGKAIMFAFNLGSRNTIVDDAADEPPPQDSWQPIATAPKNKEVLTLRGLFPGLQAVAINVPKGRDVRAGWVCVDGAYLTGVTHWRPLPPPPENAP